MIGWQELLPQSREEAQLLQRGTAGTRVLIPEWTEWLQIYDEALQRRLERHRPARAGARPQARRLSRPQ